jgi:hypothetical protein
MIAEGSINQIDSLSNASGVQRSRRFDMSPAMIVPAVKTLYLCDGHIGFANQKTDLVGIFNSIRPPRYPHLQKGSVIFAQLAGGLGQVPFFFELRFAHSGQLLDTSNVHVLNFPHRDKLIQLAYTIPGWTFAQPGRYLVESYCHGQWVADTTLELL